MIPIISIVFFGGGLLIFLTSLFFFLLFLVMILVLLVRTSHISAGVNLLHSQIWVCEIFIYVKNVHKCSYAYRNQKTLETLDDSLLVQVRNLFTFLSLRFFDMRRERGTVSFYADFSIWPQPRAAPHRKLLVWPQRAPKINLLRPSPNLNSLFFFIIPKSSARRFRAWRHSHPQSISYLGFLLWHLWLSHPPRTRLNTCTQCVHLTKPCTKPNGSQPN